MTAKERSRTSTEPAELEQRSNETAELEQTSDETADPGESAGEPPAESAAIEDGAADAIPNDAPDAQADGPDTDEQKPLEVAEQKPQGVEADDQKPLQIGAQKSQEHTISAEAALEWDVAPTRVIHTLPKGSRPREAMVTVGRQPRHFEPENQPRVERSTLLGMAPLRSPLPITASKKLLASATPLPVTAPKEPVGSAAPLPASQGKKPLAPEAVRAAVLESVGDDALPTAPLATSPVEAPVPALKDRMPSVPPPPHPSTPPGAKAGASKLPVLRPDPEEEEAAQPSAPPPDFASRRGFWLLVALAIPGGAAVGVGLNALSSPDVRPVPSVRAAAVPAPSPSPSPSPASVTDPSPAPSAEARRPSALSTLDRAAAGESPAMEELSSRPPEERQLNETVALAKGRRVAKRAELEQFGAKLREQPDLLNDRKELRRLRDYINDREITVEALALVAELPGPIGPDLLYDTWIGNPKRTETTILAEELVYSAEVRAKASPALQVALDLRKAKACETFYDIIPRAKEHGDRRSVTSLKKLLIRRGCGKKDLEDCYPCLRPLDSEKGAVSVLQAMLIARTRRPPRLQ